MKFIIKTEELKKWLSIANHATASISTTPILENILIKVNFNNIILIANNFEMAIEYMISEWIDIDTEWSFCIPSKLLISYIWLIQDENINIELLSDNSLQIKSKWWKIKIKWVDANDFPLIPSIKEEIWLTLPGKIIKQAVDKTLFSSAEWNIRPNLAGLYVNIKWENVVFASTDSFRLSEYKTKLQNSLTKDFSQIIPSKTSSQIRNILSDSDEVKIISWDNQIAFFTWNTKIYSRLLNGKFPDYSSFFPKNFNTKADIDKNDLIWALKKINLVSRENNYSIKMSLSAERWIELETSETQIWESNVTLVWSVEWEDNIIWINSIYFLEVLWVIDTTHIRISFETPLSPIMITPLNDTDKVMDYSFQHIIMPLKI